MWLRFLSRGDLLGHDTHGTGPAACLSGICKGWRHGAGWAPTRCSMNARRRIVGWRQGLPAVADHNGFQFAMDKAEYCGCYSLSIRNAHHTAGLVSYLKPVIDRGLFGLVMVSDSNRAQRLPPLVAVSRCFQPIPSHWLSGGGRGGDAGYETHAETTNGMVNRLHREKRSFDHDWLIVRTGSRAAIPRFASRRSPAPSCRLAAFPPVTREQVSA